MGKRKIDPKYCVISVRVTGEELHALRGLCRSTDEKLSDIVRQAIHKQLEHQGN